MDFLLTAVVDNLRTPLNGLHGFIQLLVESKLDAEQADIVERIRASCDLLQRVLDRAHRPSQSHAPEVSGQHLTTVLPQVQDELRRSHPAQDLPLGDHRALRVLVADQNPGNRTLIRNLLERVGHTVTIADNSRAVLETLERSPFDLVLMDVQLPELNGYAVTRLIRSGRVQRDIPVIAMIGVAIPGYRERCLESGMNDCLTRPVTPEQLYGALDRLCQS